MSVYVDQAKYRYGRMIMCHMMADTLDELHEMADAIGVDRKHFQTNKRPHYDICKTKRAEAVKLGAVEVSTRKLVDLARKHWFGWRDHG